MNKNLHISSLSGDSQRPIMKLNIRYIILVLLGALSFLVAYFSPVTNTNSDPEGSLLTSQAIIEYRSIKLDPYYDQIPPNRHQIKEVNNHFYYYYPLGTSVISIPFVALSLVFGEDMASLKDQAELQNLLSAICVSLTCLLMYQFSLKFLSLYQSLVPTIAFTFGSSLLSTNGTALWTTDYLAVIYLLIILMLYPEDNRKDSRKYILIGVLLFLAFLCRPTAAIFIFLTLLYIFIKNRNNFFYAAITSFLLLCAFIVLSLWEYGSYLPPYFILINQLKSNVFIGLFGILFSPSRGLFINSPFLVVLILGVFYFRRHIWTSHFFWLGFIWFVSHTILVSTWANWWGGHSYGSRMMVDILPALLVMSVFVLKRYFELPPSIIKKITLSFFFILTLFGILLNAYVGLFNTNILLWNVFAGADSSSEYILSWKYPQFLANRKMFQNIEFDRQLVDLSKNFEAIAPYRIGQSIYPNDNVAIYLGWYEPENFGEYRWSSRKESYIFLKFDDETLQDHQSVDLEINADVAYTKIVNLQINNTQIESFTSDINVDLLSFTVPIDVSILRTGLVEIKFITPDERPINEIDVQSNDIRNIGIRILQLKFIDHQK